MHSAGWHVNAKQKHTHLHRAHKSLQIIRIAFKDLIKRPCHRKYNTRLQVTVLQTPPWWERRRSGLLIESCCFLLESLPHQYVFIWCFNTLGTNVTLNTLCSNLNANSAAYINTALGIICSLPSLFLPDNKGRELPLSKSMGQNAVVKRIRLICLLLLGVLWLSGTPPHTNSNHLLH